MANLSNLPEQVKIIQGLHLKTVLTEKGGSLKAITRYLFPFNTIVLSFEAEYVECIYVKNYVRIERTS